MPVIFFGTQIAAAPFYPGYSFAQQSPALKHLVESLSEEEPSLSIPIKAIRE